MSGSFWTAVNTVLSVPVAFVANAVVARYLGVVDYGQLAFLTLALSLVIQVSNAGVSDSVVRWGSGWHAQGQDHRVAGLLAKSLGFHLIIQLPIVLAAVAYLARGAAPVVLVALVLSVLLPAALGSAALTLSIESRLGAGAKLAMVTGLAGQVAIALAAVMSQSPVAVWATRAVAGAVLLPFTFLLLDSAKRRRALRVALPRAMPPGFWRYSAYSCAAGIVALLVFSRSELLLLQALGAAAAAGIFALAFGLSQQITAPADALLGPLLPAISGMYAAHPERSQASLLRATRFSSVICGLLTAIGVPVVYFLIPPIYGAEFSAAAAAFVPLTIVSCLQSVSHPINTFTRARGRNDVLLRAYCIALVVDVAVALALIPSQGLLGAVIANAASQSVAIYLISRHELAALRVNAHLYVACCGFWLMSIPISLTVILAVRAWGPGDDMLRALLAGVVACAVVRAVAVISPGRLGPSDAVALLSSLPKTMSAPTGVALRVLGLQSKGTASQG